MQEIVPQKWIGRGDTVHCPACSPDLMPLDYFLWNFINQVMATAPATKEDMKDRIGQAVLKLR